MKKQYIIKFIEWIIYMLGYTLVFILVTNMFKSVYVDSSNYYNWAFIAVFFIYVLNKTIKPVLITFTIPITGITLGLFYPFINVFILKIVDWLLLDHFNIKSLFALFFVSILLSITNFIMERIINNILKRIHQNG